HHGLWWGRHEQLVGNMRRRIAGLIRNDISLYAAHIPLDCHPEVGNNVELARLFGLEVEGTFGAFKGIDVGVIARVSGAVSRDAFTRTVAQALDGEPDVLAFGPAEIARVAIVSGAGAMLVEEAARARCDTLVTGESSHSAYHMAREAGVNLYYGGHYATETVGLHALQRHLQKKFSTSSGFLSVPTGY
ncbi:MAG: Nif3-like dinuclear metal center hexameric protein, partial [Candidatus Krumholzibacteriota bacterium]|nr:Nif3-like dinuclear metal center hexameric protein [Candidatus Krumholzibacteriota bacterium]